jgi:ESS family glutamate:Na+ symporter
VLVALLLVGRIGGWWLGLRAWGIPDALLAGALGLLLGPAGPRPLLPEAVISVWNGVPLVLLTLVFAVLLLAKPLPNVGALWRPVAAQTLLALILAFGQFLVGGLAVLFLLQPFQGAHPLMALLLEVSFEGGHGSAAAMGPSYASLGFPAGQSLGLALATVGLLLSTTLGGGLVLVGQRLGWASSSEVAVQQPPSNQINGGSMPTWGELMLWTRQWLVSLALAGLAVLLAVAALAGLRQLAVLITGSPNSVLESLPVFPLALLGSLLVRQLLDRSGRSELVSAEVMGLIGALSANLLITAATACLDLPLLRSNWVALLVLASAGTIWNLLVVVLLGPRILPADWFERAVIEFGQATGVVASGLLLLRVADPNDRSSAQQPFSLKQLLLQPFLAGGLITVLAPLAVTRWGLASWTLLCLALTLLWICLGVLVGRIGDRPSATAPLPSAGL